MRGTSPASCVQMVGTMFWYTRESSRMGTTPGSSARLPLARYSGWICGLGGTGAARGAESFDSVQSFYSHFTFTLPGPNRCQTKRRDKITGKFVSGILTGNAISRFANPEYFTRLKTKRQVKPTSKAFPAAKFLGGSKFTHNNKGGQSQQRSLGERKNRFGIM